MPCSPSAQTQRAPAELEEACTSLPPTVAQTLQGLLRGHRLAEGETLFDHWKQVADYSACRVRAL
jgi:hypothetical protein